MGRRAEFNLPATTTGLKNIRLIKTKDHKDKNTLFKKGEEHRQKIGHPKKKEERFYEKAKPTKIKLVKYRKGDDSIFISGQKQVIPVSFGKLRETPLPSRQLKLEKNDGKIRIFNKKPKIKNIVGKPKKIGT